MIVAIEAAARVIAGMIKCFIVAMPVAGNSPNLRENNSISRRPNQNAGMEVKMRALTKLTASMRVYCFIADTIPTGMPIKTEIITPKNVNVSVVGKREAISLITGTLLR
jgi:hypothetical protein